MIGGSKMNNENTLSRQWYVRSKGMGNGKYVTVWLHVPTGKKFYSKDQAEAYDELLRSPQGKD